MVSSVVPVVMVTLSLSSVLSDEVSLGGENAEDVLDVGGAKELSNNKLSEMHS